MVNVCNDNKSTDSLIISAMEVGFSSTTFTGTETAGYATVCVQLLNPPSGGAVRPFSVTLLPEEGSPSTLLYMNPLLLVSDT